MAKVSLMKFAFEIEWEDPAEARGDDLRATWARLSLSVNGSAVFDVLDRNSGSARDAIYGPALPIAQWLAENWFFLLHEVGHRQDASPAYWKRHNLQFAGEGFAMPSVQIMPLVYTYKISLSLFIIKFS